MRINLYPYQEKAVEELHTGSILVGGVGTGKSRTALAYYFVKVCNADIFGACYPKNPCPLYIITTARKRDTLEWDKECAVFGLSTNRNASVANTLVAIDSWNNIAKYRDVHDAFFIFDEQRVVGSGEWSKNFIRIAKRNRWILLSATPGDTWMDYIPVFVANGFYKNRTEFIRRHVVYSRFAKYPKVDRYLETGHLIHLRNKILVEMHTDKKTIRFTKDIFVDYDKEKYDRVINDCWDPYKDRPLDGAAQVCYVARRILNDDPSRLDAVIKLSKKHDRIIIFYSYDYELDRLRTLHDILKIPVAEWNGHRHEQIPNTKKWLYLCQYTAAAEGWNCTSTDTMIFYSLSYSYKASVQAAGRIDRLNTPYKKLYYYRLKSKASMDKAVQRALSSKKNFNEKAFILAQEKHGI